ncbi:MAG: insulinase family protein, partial [Coprobacillus sp.]
NNQAKKSFEKANEIQREIAKESSDVDKKEESLTMDVMMPKVIVSLKINDILTDPKEKLKRELSMNLLLDLLFSKSSPLYEKWVQEEIINDSFSANFTQERDYSFLQFGGDTQNPNQLKDKVLELISSIKNYKIDEQAFSRIQKKNVGILIDVFNSPESIGNLFSRYYFEGIMVFDLIDTIMSIKESDLENLKELFDVQYASTFIVTSK